MNSLFRIPYRTLGALALFASRIAPSGSNKTLRSLRSRRDIVRRFNEWGLTARDTSRPLVWIHAPSVGEGLQARPVIDRIRQRTNAQLAYTFYSPSAEALAASVDADFRDYLPFDIARQMDAVLNALRPSVLAFSKADVWPILVERASVRGVKLALLSATMTESSARRSLIARVALSDAYRSLDAVGAIDDADAARLIEAGVRPDVITITGDTRYDQVWARAQTTRPQIVESLSMSSDRPTLVAGSTWPSDEEHLLPAWSRVMSERPRARLVIAPHEVTREHLDAIARWANDSRLSLSRVDEQAAATSDVVLVDRYGILGDLYALADFSYVGGGFHAAGLHSLLEPAAFGSAVIIGPRHTDNRDARLLIAAGAAFRCANGAEISSRIVRWIDSADSRKRAGDAAREVVRAGLGAAERSYAIISSLLAGTNDNSL